MARPLRIEFPGAIYHITSRGNDREDIFLNTSDRRRFLATLSKVLKRYNWSCHAYCLMNNHYHLLIETHDASLSKGMRQLNGVYTQKFNYYHDHVGHIFQGRYKAFVVDADVYFKEVARYIVLNPVRANIVDSPCDWRWSSYLTTSGTRQSPSWLSRGRILQYFPNGKFHNEYKKFVMEGIGVSSPLEDAQGGVVLGSAEFYDNTCDIRNDAMSEIEIKKSERLANRPGLQDVFSDDVVVDKLKRNEAIRFAHVQLGYSQVEIGKYLDMHYASISRIVNS